MDLGITGRKALVAGGSAGLGGASALALAVEGVELFISARGEDRLRAFAADIRDRTGATVTPVVADHGTAQGRDRLLVACPAPDILVITSSPPRFTDDYADVDPQEYRDALETGLIGPIELMRATLPGMAQRRFGRVVAISTVGARSPWEARLLSGPPRSALLNFVHAVSKKYAASNVTLNTLLPGVFRTPASADMVAAMAREKGISLEAAEEGFVRKRLRVPAGRFGRADELAPFCALLCSAHAGYMTGQSLTIDGGAVTALY